MVTLHERIIALIKRGDTTYDTIVSKGAAQGITAYEIDMALVRVHKDARVKTNGVLYSYRTPTAPQPMVHLEWVKTHYPWPKEGEFVMPFPEWDLSWMFLTPEEAEVYHAQAKPSLRGGFTTRATIKGCPLPKGASRKRSLHTSPSRVSSTGDRTTPQRGTGTSTQGTVVIGLS